jgi:light-regulated signal transduction histidine kinase (bacteriophytochrome)
LLDFSRIGRKETPFVAVDLNAVVADVVSDLEVAIANRKASVRVEPLPTLTAELTQMRQLFGNLISNALKFVREDVPPVVRVSAVPATPDDLRRTNLDPNKRFVRLSVADNGIGFEPEYAERIFVIFQRLHAQAEFEGAGIGLAVCRRIAENHGGAIYAEGTPGQGATFSVLLPMGE